jgi:hypothetical protein
MSLLDHPAAQALLNDATVTPGAVRDGADRLTSFLQRYLPMFDRVEQRHNAILIIRRLISGLDARPASRSPSRRGKRSCPGDS